MNKPKVTQLTGTSLVGDSVNRERVKEDYYATPTVATKVLLNSFDLSSCENFLEPACGEGHISKVLLNKFKDKPVYSSDLMDRGYGQVGIDFLKESFFQDFDCVITNPPFKLAQEFIEKGLKVARKYVIMFAKIQLLEGVSRKRLFDKYPPKYVYVFTDRVNPLRNGSPIDENGKKWASTMCFAWFVWEIGFKGEPTIRWLRTNGN